LEDLRGVKRLGVMGELEGLEYLEGDGRLWGLGRNWEDFVDRGFVWKWKTDRTWEKLEGIDNWRGV